MSDQPERCPRCGSDRKELLGKDCRIRPYDPIYMKRNHPWHTSATPEPTWVRSSVIDSEGRIQPIAPAPASAPPASLATQSAEQWLARNYPNLPAYVRNVVGKGTIYFDISKLCEAYATAQNAALTAELESLKADTKLLRELVFYSHGCMGKYGDDGEMQCNVYPSIDFKRYSVEQIADKARLHWLKRQKIKICENPDCPSPQFAQQRRGQKYCTHKCAVLMNVRRFRARLSNKKENQ